jgi:hypothetical protein
MDVVAGQKGSGYPDEIQIGRGSCHMELIYYGKRMDGPPG